MGDAEVLFGARGFGRGTDTVIVTGASTSGCVRATVVDALQHGASRPREAVADRPPGPREAALLDTEAKYDAVARQARLQM